MSTSRHRKQSRGRWLVAVAAALAVLVLVVTMAWADRDGGADNGEAAEGTPSLGAATTASELTDTPGPTEPGESAETTEPTQPTDSPAIALQAPVGTADRLEAVPLAGRARPGAELRVQLADRSGGWSSFPLGVVADDEGRFTTYVELGRTGANRLRMLEPATGTASNEVVVTVG